MIAILLLKIVFTSYLIHIYEKKNATSGQHLILSKTII